MNRNVFQLASAVAIIDGKEIDLASNMLRVMSDDFDPISYSAAIAPNSLVAISRNDDRIAAQASRIIGHTVTLRGTFTPSPEFWGILVGMQLQYGLREMHRNLSRYTRWPYTN